MSITLYSYMNDTQIILSYIYELLDKENKDLDCECINIDSKHYRDYKKDNSDYMFLHTFIPVNGKYVINNIEIEICDFVLNDKVQTTSINDDFILIKKVILKSSAKANIIAFIEDAIKKKFKEKKEKFAEVYGDKIIKKKWTGTTWCYESSFPKKNFDCIFLKKDHLNKIKDPILKFINKESYKDYNKHGIPYKMNIILHGSPGVGKTSLIHCIASECNANLCILNINSELNEEAMIEAISQVNHDDKKSILVLEYIDCIFSDGVLNCLDGFNNPEGLIVIMTTNSHDKLDDALLRSGRIDLNIELTYLDKFQAHNMFLSFFSSEEYFELMWDNIKKCSVEPATLMQFLFNNRHDDNISTKFEDFYKIVEKKCSKNSTNIYM